MGATGITNDPVSADQPWRSGAREGSDCHPITPAATPPQRLTAVTALHRFTAVTALRPPPPARGAGTKTPPAGPNASLPVSMAPGGVTNTRPDTFVRQLPASCQKS